MLGNTANQSTLDTGKAANDQYFWEAIQGAFVQHEDSYDVLFFQDDDVFLSLDKVYMKKAVPHSWKKLRSIWKGINSEYKAAVGHFSLSGTHTSNFYDFCNGKQDIYYLRKQLELKPNLTGTVEADLPDETFQDTCDNSQLAALVSSSNSGKRKRNDSAIKIAEAIREMNNSKMQMEFTKKRLDILQKEDLRKEKEEQCKEKRRQTK